MRQAFVFLLMFMGACFSSFSADIRKASVISDGDRGLALEWVKDLDGDVYAITNDENRDLYVLGMTYSYVGDDYIASNEHTYFVAKYTPRGELVWLKEINTDVYGQIYNNHWKLFYVNGRLFFNLAIMNNDIFYDNKKVWEKNESMPDVFFEIDANDGGFIRCDALSNITVYLDYYVDKNFNKILICPISDGEYQEYGYGKPHPKFEGMNQTNFKTDTRTNGATDFYIAKLDKDNNLVSDFALGGEGPDFGGTLGFLNASANGDTLFIFMGYQSDSLDIDPDPENEVWIYGKEYVYNRDNMGFILIQYDISGDRLSLMSYKEYDYTWYINHNLIYSHPAKGTYMAWENPSFRVEKDGAPYLQCGESHVYATVDDKSNVTIVDSIPASGGLDPLIRTHYKYDDKSNFYLPNSRVNSNRDSFPIVLNFTKDGKEHLYDEKDTWHACVSKFDTSGNYLWTVMFLNVLLTREPCYNSELGYACLKGKNFDDDYITDLSPDPNKEFLTTHEWDFLMLYRETYRIAADPVEHGEVVVPDTFAWHGEDYEIGVLPEDGYRLERITANGKELEADEAGRYFVRKVTEPICINAEFAPSTGVKNTENERLEIVPNLVDRWLQLSNAADSGMERYIIMDMSGKAMQEGTFTEQIDVQHLQPGKYLIELKGKNSKKIGTFIKK
ncbi:MAG: T9SS type A sorting domain-containing protein [Paludibacteraceae bacterium]|nr:T9SS type A sorting domain-containing protein [Paludibacteraceae bacterium]